jgi:hypothetical protein
MSGHLSAGMPRIPSRQKHTAWGETLRAVAIFVTLPNLDIAD